MTKRTKRHTLSREILGLIGISAGISLALFLILSGLATAIAEGYCFYKDIPMTELDWIPVDRWIFSVSAALACISFGVLFLFLLNDRIAYIRTITGGINRLGDGLPQPDLPLQGNNELTALAAAVNATAAAQIALREKERALALEKDSLIHSLSHDIRTPLTSILAYTDLLLQHDELPPAERAEHLQLIQKKALQIRDLTAVLLDGSRREVLHFADGRLLMEQLVSEFSEALEDSFDLQIDLSGCPAFSPALDVQELRRIFDNLASNIQKYADPLHPVTLRISVEDTGLLLCQRNRIRPRDAHADSYRIGLTSIRRIAQLYSGHVTTTEQDGIFEISILLAEI